VILGVTMFDYARVPLWCVGHISKADMNTHHIKTIISSDGGLHIDALPFSAGESVEVIVFPTLPQSSNGSAYSLRNTPITYVEPFLPTCEIVWE
jgi:hypothetical protein